MWRVKNISKLVSLVSYSIYFNQYSLLILFHIKVNIFLKISIFLSINIIYKEHIIFFILIIKQTQKRLVFNKHLDVGIIWLSSQVRLWDPMGYTVCGILQARILEWVAIPFSRGSSWLRDWSWVSHIIGRFFSIWATRWSLSILQMVVYMFPCSFLSVHPFSPSPLCP